MCCALQRLIRISFSSIFIIKILQKIWNTLIGEISTSVWSVQYPNTDKNIQHIASKSGKFYKAATLPQSHACRITSFFLWKNFHFQHLSHVSKYNLFNVKHFVGGHKKLYIKSIIDQRLELILSSNLDDYAQKDWQLNFLMLCYVHSFIYIKIYSPNWLSFCILDTTLRVLNTWYRLHVVCYISF